MIPPAEISQKGSAFANDKLPLTVVSHEAGGGSRARRWRQWAVGLVAVAIMAGILAWQVIASNRADDAAAERASATAAQAVPTVVGLGTLQPRDGVIVVALPSGSRDATISKLLVVAGDEVSAGEALAHVDTEPMLIAAVERSKADVALRNAERDRTLATVEYEQDAAEAAYRVAEIIATNARRVSDRAAALSRTNTVSAAERDDLAAAAEEADGKLDEARARAARFGGAPTLHPGVLAADAAIDAARAALAAAETDLRQAVVAARTDGTILSVIARVGERPSEGLLRMADTSAMVAKVEVFQSRIHAVSVGDAVTLTSDALAAPLHGTVTAIGAEVVPQGEISDDAAANTNARVIEVTVTLDAASTKASRLLTNLQVLATVTVGGAS
jgi:HlyD family secretion protein